MDFKRSVHVRNLSVFPTIALLVACQAPVQAPLAVIPNRQQEVTKITLGGVQANLKKGAASATVIDVLGSPNLVTSNADGTETWVYDKMSFEQEVAVSGSSGVSTKSSRTMLVVIRFDSSKKIEEIKYRQTSY